ncbi:MAG: carbamoyl-phosphate synthase large subunit [Pseudomonadota bacterium]
MTYDSRLTTHDSRLKNCESFPTNRKKVIILGSGPNRIGQGIEFDYTCVHAAFALREIGIEAIMVNCNPETVSTDYDTSDRLYFEPLTAEDVLELVQKEQENGELLGVNVQFGGQTPLGLAKFLQDENVPIIGTSPDMIDLAEDRDRFKKLLEQLGLKQPQNYIAYCAFEVIDQVNQIGFPVVVRPSYVLGGKGMAIVYDVEYLHKYLAEYSEVFETGPLLLDQFLTDAIEVDVDALCDGEEVFVAGIMQHIEEAGIHSGDSACSIPPYSLSDEIIEEIKQATIKMALALNVKGLMNVQYAIKDNQLYVLEVNPRASRTVPFVAKATKIPLAKIATLIMVGKKLSEFKLEYKKPNYFSVKEVVFPFARFNNVDIILGPEMKSTGEVMGIDKTFPLAFAKAQIAAGVKLPTQGLAFLSVKDSDKKYLTQIAKDLTQIGFEIIATKGTAKFLNDNGVAARVVNKVAEGKPHIVDMIAAKEIALIINTTEGATATKDSFSIRRTALIKNTTYSTTISGAKALIAAIQAYKEKGMSLDVTALQDL